MQMVHHGDSLPGRHSVWGLRWEDARAGSGLTAGGWNHLEVFSLTCLEASAGCQLGSPRGLLT